jgi:hypothetical protein
MPIYSDGGVVPVVYGNNLALKKSFGKNQIRPLSDRTAGCVFAAVCAIPGGTNEHWYLSRSELQRTQINLTRVKSAIYRQDREANCHKRGPNKLGDPPNDAAQ